MRKLIIPALLVFCIVQLYFISSPIIINEDVLKNGKEFNFRIAPVDPEDPFRGRYVTLTFRDNEIDIAPNEEWQYDEMVFAELYKAADGYARIKKLHRERPPTPDYIKASVAQLSFLNGRKTVFLDLPFDRFYADENKAPLLEEQYRQAVSDTSSVACVTVCVKNGNAVIKELVLNSGL